MTICHTTPKKRHHAGRLAVVYVQSIHLPSVRRHSLSPEEKDKKKREASHARKPDMHKRHQARENEGGERMNRYQAMHEPLLS
jgi:hypothetical protein